MNVFRRYIAAGFLCMGVAAFAASPASAQTNTYNAAEVGPPMIAAPGGMLSSSGTRVVVPAPAVPGQVLSLQVSQPAPLATGGQASVSNLAFTGADVVTLLMMAVSMIVVGFTLTRRARPRRESQG